MIMVLLILPYQKSCKDGRLSYCMTFFDGGKYHSFRPGVIPVTFNDCRRQEFSVIAYTAADNENWQSISFTGISLEEIVDDADWFRSALYEALIVRYEQLGEDAIMPNTKKVCFDTEWDNFRWVMDQGGIYIIFNPYCIRSFAEGVFHVYLTFSDYPGMFSGQFLNNSKVWFEQNDVWLEH